MRTSADAYLAVATVNETRAVDLGGVVERWDGLDWVAVLKRRGFFRT
jgi:hypothetical protein